MVAGFLRFLHIHLQICWQLVPGKKFFWSSIMAGWGLPALFIAIALPLTGVSYRFGNTCHINHEKALDDYWGPLLAFAAISTVLQFGTFGYCIRVYIRSLFNDSKGSTSEPVNSNNGLPSYASRAGSVKTVTAGQAYRRVKKVIALQWRGTVIVLIIIINVVFLAVVFVQMDNTVTSAVQNLGKAEPWLLCLVLNGGNKNPCLDKVKAVGLVTNEATVMAVLLLLSVSHNNPNQPVPFLRLTRYAQLNGFWAILFLGRTSMLYGWLDLLRSPFAPRPTDFVSVDARRFSNNPKTYEMISSPLPQSSSMPKAPQAVVTSSSTKERGLSPLTQSPDSGYANDYFSNEVEQQPPTFGKEAAYRSPKLSFSTPRPPSAGPGFSSENSISFSTRIDSSPRPLSPQGRYSPAVGRRQRAESRESAGGRSEGGGRFSPIYDWDPTSSYAQGSKRGDTFEV